ncbi:protein transport protein HofB [Escherichia coli]|uniref:Protein transport protein HofB n=1 Tax=Escherichia coli TaxID=562 RepID=A0A377CII4_ECOLX|nr:protein transport protein HofB [Escherichia coli]
MNIPQLTALCLRYHGVLLDASEEVVHVAVVDAPSHELLDALHFATTKRIEITCWTRQQMEGHASRTQQTLPVAVSGEASAQSRVANSNVTICAGTTRV